MDYSDYISVTTTTTTGSGDLEAAGAIFMTMMIVGIIVALLGYAITSFLTSRIFKKAGIKQSIAWIPIYSTWKMLEMGDQKGYWAPLMLVPGVNIVSIIFYYIALYHIGKKFGKEDWFVILAILVAPVWFIILGFDKSVWNGTPAAATPVAEAAPATYVPPVQSTQADTTPEPTAPVADETPAMAEDYTPAEPTVESTPDSSSDSDNQ